MKLDLRKNGTLDVDFIKKINQLEPTVRDEYKRTRRDGNILRNSNIAARHRTFSNVPRGSKTD